MRKYCEKKKLWVDLGWLKGKNHKKFHENPEALTCKVCGKISTTTKNFKKHIKKVHPAENQEKIKCLALFTL